MDVGGDDPGAAAVQLTPKNHLFCRQRAFMTFLAVAALSQSGCAIMTQMEASRQRDHYSFTPSFSIEDTQFRRWLDNVGSVIVGGNHAQLLENGDGLFPAIEKDILEAKHSVNIETYIFKPDEVGRRLADAMIGAARRGVEVRLLVDAQGSTLGSLRKELDAAGVRCNARCIAPPDATRFSEGAPTVSS